MLRIALVQFSFQRSPAISGRFLVFIGQLKLVLSVSQLVQINSQWFSANSGRFAVFLGQFKPICIVTWFFLPVQAGLRCFRVVNQYFNRFLSLLQYFG
jgi:hypothetical protein